MPTIYSADHIAGQMGGYEPVRRNNFIIDLAVPGGDFLRLSVEEANIPTEASEVIRLVAGNETFAVAGTTSIESFTFTFKDFVAPQVAAALMKWRKLVFDPESGIVRYGQEYKVEGSMSMLAPDDGSPSQKWKLINMWPVSVAPGKGGMSDNTINMIIATFSVDRAILQATSRSAGSVSQAGGNLGDFNRNPETVGLA